MGNVSFLRKEKRYTIEEAARQLISLYAQASDLRSEIVVGIRDLFINLNNNSRGLLQHLATLSLKIAKTSETPADLLVEKAKAMKQCKNYSTMMNNVFNLLNVLVQCVESREHIKLFMAINENNEIIHQVIELSKIAGMFKVIGEKDKKFVRESFSYHNAY